VSARPFIVDTGRDYVETTLRQPNAEWITTPQVAELLSISTCTWTQAVRPTNDYMGLRNRVRGTRGKVSARGQGWLWDRRDVLLVLHIRRSVKCSTTMALRIFRAHRLGGLHLVAEVNR